MKDSLVQGPSSNRSHQQGWRGTTVYFPVDNLMDFCRPPSDPPQHQSRSVIRSMRFALVVIKIAWPAEFIKLRWRPIAVPLTSLLLPRFFVIKQLKCMIEFLNSNSTRWVSWRGSSSVDRWPMNDEPIKQVELKFEFLQQRDTRIYDRTQGVVVDSSRNSQVRKSR